MTKNAPDLLAGTVLSSDARLGRIGLGLALAAAVGSTLFLQHVGVLLPACLFHELTGVSCLTCGLTRSLEAAAHGNILTALQFHLLGPFLLAGIAAACIALFTEAVTGRHRVWFRHGRGRQMLLGFAAVWIVYGVTRAIVELV
jgi:hypothetical protein